MRHDWKSLTWVTGVGPGWKDIVQPLVDYCKVHDLPIDQVKEKFGGLRFYYSRTDETLDRMIEEAEAKAWVTCEECGAPGSPRGGGWVRTLCDTHAEGREPLKRAIAVRVTLGGSRSGKVEQQPPLPKGDKAK